MPLDPTALPGLAGGVSAGQALGALQKQFATARRGPAQGLSDPAPVPLAQPAAQADPTMTATSTAVQAQNPGNNRMPNQHGFGGMPFMFGPMGRGMGGMGKGFGGFLGNLQLPTDMTASQFIDALRNLNFRDLRQQFHSDLRDYRHNGGDRPIFANELAAALGGTYGAAPAATAPAAPAQSIAVGEPNPAAVIDPGLALNTPAAPPPLSAQDFYQTHGFYPGG